MLHSLNSDGFPWKSELSARCPRSSSAILCHKYIVSFFGLFLPFAVSFSFNRSSQCMPYRHSKRHKMPLVGVLLWHSKVPPMRAQYLEGSGPMRVLHSGSRCKLRDINLSGICSVSRVHPHTMALALVKLRRVVMYATKLTQYQLQHILGTLGSKYLISYYRYKYN